MKITWKGQHKKNSTLYKLSHLINVAKLSIKEYTMTN